MAGKYRKYITNPQNLQIKLSDVYPVDFKKVIINNTRFGYNVAIALRLITEPSTWIHPVHSHDFQEFLAWYGAHPNNPDNFEAEVVFYMGEEEEKYVFVKPTIVSIPPGLVHCPLAYTEIRKPIIQLAIQVTGKNNSNEAV